MKSAPTRKSLLATPRSSTPDHVYRNPTCTLCGRARLGSIPSAQRIALAPEPKPGLEPLGSGSGSESGLSPRVRSQLPPDPDPWLLPAPQICFRSGNITSSQIPQIPQIPQILVNHYSLTIAHYYSITAIHTTLHIVHSPIIHSIT